MIIYIGRLVGNLASICCFLNSFVALMYSIRFNIFASYNLPIYFTLLLSYFNDNQHFVRTLLLVEDLFLQFQIFNISFLSVIVLLILPSQRKCKLLFWCKSWIDINLLGLNPKRNSSSHPKILGYTLVRSSSCSILLCQKQIELLFMTL